MSKFLATLNSIKAGVVLDSLATSGIDAAGDNKKELGLTDVLAADAIGCVAAVEVGCAVKDDDVVI